MKRGNFRRSTTASREVWTVTVRSVHPLIHAHVLRPSPSVETAAFPERRSTLRLVSCPERHAHTRGRGYSYLMGNTVL